MSSRYPPSGQERGKLVDEGPDPLTETHAGDGHLGGRIGGQLQLAQLPFRVGHEGVINLGEVAVLGGDPEDGDDGPSQLLLHAAGEQQDRQRLVRRVQGAAEQPCLLASDHDKRFRVGEPADGGERRRTRTEFLVLLAQNRTERRAIVADRGDALRLLGEDFRLGEMVGEQVADGCRPLPEVRVQGSGGRDIAQGETIHHGRILSEAPPEFNEQYCRGSAPRTASASPES